MSHFKERAEKICLNCTAELHGRYCHVCGQENREAKETVWSLVSHFFSDVTHFDGAFFRTTGKLITRPGFLPKEYIKGRRASWLNPIRMYIFSSAIFFIIFFSMFKPRDIVGVADKSTKAMDTVRTRVATAKETALKDATTKEDSLAIERVFGYMRNIAPSKPYTLTRQDTTVSRRIKPSKKRDSWNFSMYDTKYKSRGEYDSAQAALPPGQRDGWIKRRSQIRSIELSQRYKDREEEMWKEVLEGFFHSFPYLLFVSLPLYALYLKLLYIRRKRFYYVDHGIFLIHLYIFTFIFLLVFLGISELHDKWEWLDWLEFALILYGIYYAFRAMRKFYEQGWWKTFFKFILLNFLALTSLIILFVIFFVLTVFRF